jgi:hypothetical protein
MRGQKLIATIRSVEAYRDSARTFIQLSSAGMAVPFFLIDKMEYLPEHVAQPGARHILLLLLGSSWVCFLISIASGAMFQYVGIKYTEVVSIPDTYVPAYLQKMMYDWGPGVVYGVMLATFVLGGFVLSAYAAWIMLSMF